MTNWMAEKLDRNYNEHPDRAGQWMGYPVAVEIFDDARQGLIDMGYEVEAEKSDFPYTYNPNYTGNNHYPMIVSIRKNGTNPLTPAIN